MTEERSSDRGRFRFICFIDDVLLLEYYIQASTVQECHWKSNQQAIYINRNYRSSFCDVQGNW